jgi:hypothetical protein
MAIWMVHLPKVLCFVVLLSVIFPCEFLLIYGVDKQLLGPPNSFSKFPMTNSDVPSNVLFCSYFV